MRQHPVTLETQEEAETFLRSYLQKNGVTQEVQGQTLRFHRYESVYGHWIFSLGQIWYFVDSGGNLDEV